MFSVFKTLKDEAIAAWVTKAKTIELYDLEKQAAIKKIKSGHTKVIHTCRYLKWKIKSKKKIDYFKNVKN